MADPNSLRQKGNEAFKLITQSFTKWLFVANNHNYTLAHREANLKCMEKSAFYKNRAACFLKMKKYQDEFNNGTRSFDLTPEYTETLYRCCQAYDQIVKAYKWVKKTIGKSSILTEQAREGKSNGTHETHVSEGAEADLHHYATCKKNPGHTDFVPVGDFNINNLPSNLHDNDLVDYIQATANLTVRICVTMNSMERPEFWPKSKCMYPFYKIGRRNDMRVGTGMVFDLKKWMAKENKGTCQCDKCQLSDTPSIVWGEVNVNTARHVVFDEIEARNTKCRLFYDIPDCPLVTLDGRVVRGANTEEDWSVFTCVTCDVHVLNKLDKMINHWYNMMNKVTHKYRDDLKEDHKFTFIVSHPHGCPKMVSVGYWKTISGKITYGHNINSKCDIVEVLIHRRLAAKYSYTTCTCPGSSGANVQTLSYDETVRYNDFLAHSGVDSKGINFSGIGHKYV